jgi:hypothetical protein
MAMKCGGGGNLQEAVEAEGPTLRHPFQPMNNQLSALSPCRYPGKPLQAFPALMEAAQPSSFASLNADG